MDWKKKVGRKQVGRKLGTRHYTYIMYTHMYMHLRVIYIGKYEVHEGMAI